jgi:hypothetical protein
MKPHPRIIRQGDVCLVQVERLPAACDLVPGQEQKIVLAWGEATGHHHRIEDHVQAQAPRTAEAHNTAIATIVGARARARLWRDKNGDRFLEVEAPVTLRHEEHTAHTLPRGVYKLPNQVEYAPSLLRRVVD